MNISERIFAFPTSEPKTERVDEVEVRKLDRLRKDIPLSSAFYLSRDAVSQKIGNVRCLPWNKGLSEIFGLRHGELSR